MLESYKVKIVLKEEGTKRITDSEQAAIMARNILTTMDDDREHFLVFFLDKKLKLKAFKVLFTGTIDETPVYPREIAKDALLNGASAVVCVHNHPSGSVTPSPDDLRVTNKIKEALKLLDMRLMDHIVITNDQHYSMSENGVL